MDGVTGHQKENAISLLCLVLSWEDRHNKGSVSSSGCRTVNMALIFLYKLYKTGKQGWFQNLFSMQFGGALVQSISASKRNNIATKNWHIILVKKDKVLVCSIASFQPDPHMSDRRVKDRKDKRVAVFF